MADQLSAPRKRNTRQQLRTIDGSSPERHASWLELFFDLVFVLAVSKVAMILATNTDVYGFLKYVALFVPLWWSWVGFTFYADRFESEELSYRILMFAGMLAVAALSLTLDGAFTLPGDVAFVICYVLVLLILLSLYARSALYIPLARGFALQYTFGLGLTAVLLVLSLLFSPPWRYWVWAAALIFELGIPFLNRRLTRTIPFDFTHIPERLGLFTIIVLGEAVIATANGAGNVTWNLGTITAATLGFAMAACIWWMNFEFVEDSAIRSRSLVPRFIYLYGHFFIVSSIVAFGIGIEHSIKEISEPHLHTPTLWLLAGGTSVCLGSITVIRLVSGVCRLVIIRVAAIAIALILVYAGLLMPPLAVIAVFFVVFVMGVWLESRYTDEKPKDEIARLEACEHEEMATVFHPRSTIGCEECIKNNYKWIHLRICLTCGHVGCCDSSIHKHATKHFHKENHPLMASLEDGENWSWCYVDERFVPLAHRIGKVHDEHLELKKIR
jgi:low temperature requirement protein LtrA